MYYFGSNEIRSVTRQRDFYDEEYIEVSTKLSKEKVLPWRQSQRRTTHTHTHRLNWKLWTQLVLRTSHEKCAQTIKKNVERKQIRFDLPCRAVLFHWHKNVCDCLRKRGGAFLTRDSFELWQCEQLYWSCLYIIALLLTTKFLGSLYNKANNIVWKWCFAGVFSSLPEVNICLNAIEIEFVIKVTLRRKWISVAFVIA